MPQVPEPGSFPEPPQLAQNTPKSILCKDPIAFCCWGKPRICLLKKLTTLTYEGQESSLEPIWVTMGPSLMLFQVSSLSMLCMDPYYRTQVQLKWAFAEGSSNFVLIPAATSHLSSRFSTLMAVCIWTNYGKTKGLSRHTLLQHALFFACWDRWVFWKLIQKEWCSFGHRFRTRLASHWHVGHVKLVIDRPVGSGRRTDWCQLFVQKDIIYRSTDFTFYVGILFKDAVLWQTNLSLSTKCWM